MENAKTLALELARQGWYVFPCKPDKTPLVKWKEMATLDLDAIEAMTWPGLIGVYCAKSGFFAIDFDVRGNVNGLTTWTKWQEQYGQAITGPLQQTPSGGAHALFKLPAGINVPNKAGLFPGIDLRSEGYICTGGAGYKWLRPIDTPIPEAPGWFLEFVKNDKPEKTFSEIAKDTAKKYSGANNSPAYWLDKFSAQAALGRRNETGFSLACQVRDGGYSQAECEALEYPERVPQNGQDVYDRAEWLATVKSAYDRTPREPAKKQGAIVQPVALSEPPEPEAPPDLRAKIPEGEAPGEAQPMEAGEVTSYSTWADINSGPIEYSWPGWLVNGLLTLLVSYSGDGKSLLALRICGCFIKGQSYPDGTPYKSEIGKVLWVECEAAQALNLDRAKTFKYPLGSIITPFNDPLADVSLDDPEHRAIIERRAALPEVKLIIIDSLSGGSRRKENETGIKDICLWAAKLARDLVKPTLLIHHLGKRKEWDSEVITLDRVRGSSAIVQFARVVWALSCPDVTNKETKRLEQIKNNLARFPEAIGMTAGEGGIKFGIAPTAPHVETSGERVTDLLLTLLKAGPVKATDIEAELDGAGLSMVTAKRSKERLGIVSFRKDNAWYWALPARQAE